MKLSKYITAILLYAVFILLLITAGSICCGRFDYRIISINPEQTADSGVIAAAAEKHQVLAYTLFEKQTGKQEPELCYYTDKDRISDLQKHFGIKNGKTRTLFSFSQNVRFASWEELDPDTAEQLTNWYLIGPEENCKACIREIRNIYTLESFAADEDSFLKLLAAILIVIMVALLCCCYMDAAFEKKEIAVRVIHGDSALRYYLKLTLTDIAVFSVIFIAGRLLQQCFTQIYKPYQYLYCLTLPLLPDAPFSARDLSRQSAYSAYPAERRCIMIRIENLKKAFDTHVLFDVFSLEIPDKEFAVFTGASGCGKTTLLNMIGGIEPADSGEIIVDDLNITKTKNLKTYFRQYVGFLFQNFALVENKTVEENLKMVRDQARSKVSMNEALDRVGMLGREKQKVFSLSGGEQQRIALARLMMKQCRVVLADEPTGSLDRANAEQVMRILKSFSDMGKTVIMVTHDPTLIDDSMRRIVLEGAKAAGNKCV